jgi:hypothetical protein
LAFSWQVVEKYRCSRKKSATTKAKRFQKFLAIRIIFKKRQMKKKSTKIKAKKLECAKYSYSQLLIIIKKKNRSKLKLYFHE